MASPEASAELKSLLLWAGRPVKEEDWEGEWRDYDWDHPLNDCSGWQETGQSEVVTAPHEGATLFMLTHCRCACRVFPLVTVGLEGTLGG